MRYNQFSRAENYSQTGLHYFLQNYFTIKDELQNVFSQYQVLVSSESHYEGYFAIVFPYKDKSGKIRKVEQTLYDPFFGELLKCEDISQRLMKGYDLLPKPILFGTHLLTSEPNKPIAIIENPRDAMILSLDDSSFIYLATGSPMTGGRILLAPEVLDSLKGRNATLLPAVGGYHAADRIAKQMTAKGVPTAVDETMKAYDSAYPLTKADLLLKSIEDEQFFKSFPFDEAPDPSREFLDEWEREEEQTGTVDVKPF